MFGSDCTSVRVAGTRGVIECAAAGGGGFRRDRTRDTRWDDQPNARSGAKRNNGLLTDVQLVCREILVENHEIFYVGFAIRLCLRLDCGSLSSRRWGPGSIQRAEHLFIFTDDHGVGHRSLQSQHHAEASILLTVCCCPYCLVTDPFCGPSRVTFVWRPEFNVNKPRSPGQGYQARA